ncbi:hypothetical protein HYH02_012432 [Chlamydomonas schloesseri]|uniref:RING-CH-type domain-containing protein n=1 Tax=Chlamydomonas schloesseri TaxID=2026947 RepID=A0A835T9E2_9CHLO|nr:hypothetical protein HYH02_012432 [Chlamydomonas schloesseri]|eukprot:KAG2433970.1 hypothetical protein HYH02_012432 [Chlamydomonas schloesseri]
MECALCSISIDKTDDHRLLDCGVCKRDDIFVHEDCISTYLKKEGRGQAQKTGFKCPTVLGNGKPCKGIISKSHPYVATNEAKKEKARQAAANPPSPLHPAPRGASTTAKGSVAKSVKTAMSNSSRPAIVKLGQGGPPLRPAHPTTMLVLGDFLAQPTRTAPPPNVPPPVTASVTGNVWLARVREAHAKQLASACQGQAQQPSQGSNDAEEVAGYASGEDDLAWSSASGSTAGGADISTPGGAHCLLLDSLSPQSSLLASPATLGSAPPSPTMEKNLAQQLMEQVASTTIGSKDDLTASTTPTHVTSENSSAIATIAMVRNLITSGQLAWVAPVAAELQEVMQAAAGGGSILFCTLMANDSSNLGSSDDPIVAVQPVFELSLTPLGLTGCGSGDLTQTVGVKVVRDARTLACYNPADYFGPGYSLVSFEVLVHWAGEAGVGSKAVVAQGVPIRRSQILAAGDVTSTSAVLNYQCQQEACAQSALSDSDDELALELASLCGCSC